MNKISMLSLVLSVTALGLVLAGRAPVSRETSLKETAFDRVQRTGTLRCGYPVWAPTIILDPNTKKISGYSHDIAEAVGAKLGLKVEWTEETGWGTGEQGLATGRYDMVCADVCLDAQRTKATWYATPYIHTPNYVFVKKDDPRFDDPSKLNDPSVKFAVLPNTILDYAVHEKYPLAGRVDVADLQANSDLIQTVLAGKADASVNMPITIDQYNANNPERPIKAVDTPLRNCHGGFLLPLGDAKFKTMIDAAITELNMSGQAAKIIKNYVPDDRRYWWLPAMPYKD